MSTQASYNGWPNRETWNVMLWLDNDEGAYRHYCARVRELARNGGKRRIRGTEAREIAGEALGERTGDGVSLDSPKIRWSRIAEAMRESV